METFVSLENKVKINILNLKNTSDKAKKLKLLYYIKPVLGEDEKQTNGYINIEAKVNCITAQNLYTDNFKGTITFVGSSEKIASFTGSKEEFIGKRRYNKTRSIR